MGRLEGKVALVTGAARGTGAEIARRFVAEGARVVVTDLLDEAGEALAKDLGAGARYRIHAVRGAETLDMEHLFMIGIREDGLITEGVFAPIDQHRYDHFFRPQ